MARARRTLGWVGGSVLLAAAVWAIYVQIVRLAERGPEYAANRLILPLLNLIVIVLVLALAGLLVRNLVRLVLDRKRGILGARLRAKLVFFLLGFVLIPALVMVYGSSAVIKKTMEGLVRTPVEEITRSSRDLVDDWNDFLEARCRQSASRLAAEIAGGLPADGLDRWLDDRMREQGLGYVLLSRSDDEPRLRLDPDVEFSAEEADRLARDATALLGQASARGEPVGRIEDLGRGLLVHAAVAGPPAGLPEGTAVAVGVVHSHQTTARMRWISRQADLYQQFRVQSRDLTRMYLSLIALVLLVTLFLATWIGFTMGRRITGPIEEVAAAAREISVGNLGARVRSSSGDEVGVLIESFNDMAAQIEESREVIGRSNADLRQSNRALDERRRYIETLVANLSTAVISTDRTGRVTTANPAVERILGIRLAPHDALLEALGRSDLRPLRDLLDEAVRGGADESRHDLALALDRGILTLAVHVSALHGGQDERLGTLIMIEDLSDLVRAQRAAAWREVARRIAHEIKNPLTPIQLSAQRLRKKFQEGAGDLASVLPEATDVIEREVAGLKHLVDEFSRYARMPEVVPREVDVGEIVEAVLALYKGLPGVRWQVDVPGDLGRAKLDPEQMRRALINLVENSVAAMDGRGTIRLAVARTRGVLRFEVADDGPGIGPKDREKLFVPYFSTKQSGTGLGLAIVHRVVTDHRGAIRVEDNVPRGARFVIEIPV